MEQNKIDSATNVSGAAGQNIGDAVISIFRDAVHGHLNTISSIGDMIIPKSLGTVLRHDIPSSRSSQQGINLWPCNCTFGEQIKQAFQPTSAAKANDNPESYSVQFAVPGWDRSDLEVRVNVRQITIRGRKSGDQQTEVVTLGTWTAPEPLSPNRANASLDKGVLEVMVYKDEEARAVRVPINPA